MKLYFMVKVNIASRQFVICQTDTHCHKLYAWNNNFSIANASLSFHRFVHAHLAFKSHLFT